MEENTLNEAVEKTGWNEQSQIAVLIEYISNQQSPDAFSDFISQKVNDELNS